MPLTTDYRRPRHGRRGPAVLPVFLLAFVLMSTAALAGGYERLPVRRWEPEELQATPAGRAQLEAELRRQGESVRRWKAVHELVGDRHVSAKSQRLLAERGLGAAKLAPGADADKTLDGVDTLRVLFVRIAFDGNRSPNLTTVPANGGFMLEPLAAPGPLEVDPPPHGKAYFESHLQGLSEYYRFMSGGRLHIEGRVLPETEDGAYLVDDVADYGPGAGGFWSLTGLESLVRDMITAADEGTQGDGSVNLADYDDDDPFTYVIFVHAGSDWQSDINGDSPNDVPTFFVNLGEPQALTSLDSDGTGVGSLTECSVIPETTNQDGYAGSIAAAFYHEFGHALGLVDVYDSSRGLPSVGIWDLMDSGTNLSVTLGTITDEGDTLYVAAGGVLPPSLSAWDKWFLGWLETQEIDGSRAEYRLPAVGVPRDDYAEWQANGYGAFSLSDPQAWRGGLSPREWFLIENRWVPVATEPHPYDGFAFERDDTTGVILYLAGLLAGTEDQWENSGFYDYFLPAGGALVWHVNADRIEAGLADNTINTEGDGLKLVEADGIQDIGVLDSYVLGWYGSWRDPFGGLDADGNATGFTELTVDGRPNTRMFDRSWSHLALSGIGPRVARTAAVMKFAATLGDVPAGLPWEIATESAATAGLAGGVAGPRAIDTGTLTPLEVGGTRLLLFTDAPGVNHGTGSFDASLYAVTDDGRQYWLPPVDRPEGAVIGLGGRAAGAPLVVPADGGLQDIYVSLREGTLRAVRVSGSGVTPRWQTALADSLKGGPVPLVDAGGVSRLAVLAPPRSVFLVGADGAVQGTALPLVDGQAVAVVAAGAWAVPGADGEADRLCVASASGWHLVATTVGGWDASPVWTPYARAGSGRVLAAVVPDADGAMVHLFDALGPLGSWRVEGATVTALDRMPAVTGMPVCEPAVADLDGDGLNDLVVATSERLHALKADGVPLRGWPRRLSELFPLADTTRVAGPLVIADATGDGQNELFFNTDGGHLLGLGPDGRLLAQFPLRWGDRRAAGLAIGDGQDGRLLWLVSEGGYTAPPLERTWVNGRIAGWNLALPAGEGVTTTSEWLGSGGSIARRGPAGIARDLGEAAPAAIDRAEVILFPNPVSGEAVNVRFWADGDGPARLAVYNLQGELVRDGRYAAAAGQMNQLRLELPGIASGMYITVLEYDGDGGRRTRTMTLAVER
ncbi:MAG: immune inhibitor A [bacterium]|nr:immune inhibitor A [bacterium]